MSVRTDLMPCFLRYLILAWPAGMVSHELMTSVETASVARSLTYPQRASLKRTECRTPSTTYTGGFVCDIVRFCAGGESVSGSGCPVQIMLVLRSYILTACICTCLGSLWVLLTLAPFTPKAETL